MTALGEHSAVESGRATHRPWVLCIAYCDLPADARVLRETRELLRTGARVTVLVPESDSVASLRGLEDAEVIWLPVPQERGRSSLRGQIRFMRAVRAWCRNQPVASDVVHIHNMPDYLYWCVRDWHRAGSRVVVDVHDIMSELALHRFRGAKRALAVPLLRWSEHHVWRRVDHVITVHDLYRDRIAGRGIPLQKVSVVLNSPDPELVTPELRRPPPTDQFKIVFHGTVTHRSGIVHAVNAMPTVLATVPNAKLYIVGTGEASTSVRAAIVQKELQGSVEFTDAYVPLPQALARVADAHVGLVPNEVSEYTAAMLPVKLTEYATLGIPVVATALPLVQGYFGRDAVELIDRPEPSLIAEAIVRLAGDAQRRAVLAESARRFTREHGWSRYANALITALGLPTRPATFASQPTRAYANR